MKHEKIGKICLILIVMGSMVLLHSGAFAFENASVPSLIDTIRWSDEIVFCKEPVPLEETQVRERFEKEMMLTLWDRPQIILWLKRSNRYMPIIEAALKANKMPLDLKYVAVAESALRPHVGSPKGAMGFWQLMPETARRYGLKVNGMIDERRNIHTSTQAALTYLRDLHDKLGSWTLAAAAYNMGEEGLVAEMMEQGTEDYYHLYLPLETQRFIFRIVTAKLVLTEPEKFGFHLKAEDLYTPIEKESVKIQCYQEIPIRVVAAAADSHFKVIKDLNPELRGHYLAVGSHNLSVPKGAAKGFQKRYEKLAVNFFEQRRERIYIVKNGDNLSDIAKRFDVPLAALIIWNRLDLSKPIHPGDRLYIFPGTGAIGP